jgi:hypothetical protein
MAYIPKEGSGSLFRNERKNSENHPDYTGSIMVNNRECYLSAWVKEGTKGKFFSVSIGKEKEAKGFTPKGADELVDSDLPF